MRLSVQNMGAVFWAGVSVTSIIALWQFATMFGGVSNFLLPAPVDVARRILSLFFNGEVVREAVITLYRVAFGFALAVVIGAIVGLAMGSVRLVERALDPVISVLFPTPKISFLPIFILWFGAFDLSKVLITALICVFPVISACHEGLKDIDSRLAWVGRNMGMSNRRVFSKIVLPATVPALINGAEVSLPFAFISVVTAEMMAGGGGIGARMMLAARFADSRAVFAWLVVLAVLGAMLTGVARVARRQLLRWHTEVS